MPSRHKMALFFTISVLGGASPLPAQQSPLTPAVEQRIAALEPKVIEWRRDIHQNPELGNRETRTAALVTAHLQSLGIEVQTGVAHTGVIGILRGGRPGPVVALRADMDALPVTERVNVPFASRVTTQYNGAQVGVMHACGHDAHVAILMGAAEVLAGMKNELQGTVKFIFQPAEEGAPAGEEGGAQLMVKEGVLSNPNVDAVFGLHISSVMPVGGFYYSPRGAMASSDSWRIVVKGKQTHGAMPWGGVDPVVTAAHIVTALQTIVSRNIDVTRNAAVVTVGMFNAGVRSNIVPEQAELIGTMRALTPADRATLHARLRSIATNIAESMGATAEVTIPHGTSYPVTFNDTTLTPKMVPVLQRLAGVTVNPPQTGAEDFSFFAEKVPGFYFWLGGMPANVSAANAPAHHTPDFHVDEGALKLGVRAMTSLAVEYLRMHAPR